MRTKTATASTGNGRPRRQVDFHDVEKTLAAIANVACRADEFHHPLSNMATFITDFGDDADHAEALIALAPITERMCARFDAEEPRP